MDARRDRSDAAFAIIVVCLLALLGISILVFGQGFLFSAQIYLGG